MVRCLQQSIAQISALLKVVDNYNLLSPVRRLFVVSVVTILSWSQRYVRSDKSTMSDAKHRTNEHYR